MQASRGTAAVLLKRTVGDYNPATGEQPAVVDEIEVVVMLSGVKSRPSPDGFESFQTAMLPLAGLSPGLEVSTKDRIRIDGAEHTILAVRLPQPSTALLIDLSLT